MAKQRSDTVPISEFEAVVKQLEAERLSHAAACSALIQTQDKLDFSLGEILVLKKQLEREKRQFETAFGAISEKSLRNAEKNVGLCGQNEEMERQCKYYEDALHKKNEEIDKLNKKLEEQEHIHKQKLTELSIQLQQQMYIAKVMDDKDKYQKKPLKQSLKR